MTKQLRLSVGELTDVGRRRERNQDNVTHFVPEDPEVLERRGALFVVCDGMGGHAAGEIASEIAVTTIRDVYFEETAADVVTALSRAVRAANTAIFDHAREHQTHSGMGTTCVAVALVGGHGFFANVGDSRAYIMRDGALRQVTLDHSWVAEQVRAGILTEQQARVHAHRNVITRSLGTQPEVVADLFIEDMREGDQVLLCSDGLHGYVAEEDILNAILQMEPAETAQHLVDLANANGGPDNITAVVVCLLEVPEPSALPDLPQTIKLPRDRVAIADMPTQRPMTEAESARRAGTGVLTPVAADADTTLMPSARSSVAADGPTSRPSRGARSPRSRSRWPVVALRLLAVAALLLLVAGMWDVVAGPYATDRAANDQALHDINNAEAVVQAASTQSPPLALATLSSVRELLSRDLATLPLDATGRAVVIRALDDVIAPAVRHTLQLYNADNQIVDLPNSAATSYSLDCATTAGTLASGMQTLAAIGPTSAPNGQDASSLTLYAVTGTGALYQLDLASATGSATCGGTPLIPANVHAITSDAGALYALVTQGATWQVLQVGTDGKSTAKVSAPIPAGVAPSALAVHGGDFYVAYVSSQTGASGVWHYTGDPKKPPVTTSVATAVSGLAVTSAGTPFALLADGSLIRLDAAGHATTIPLAVAPLIAPSNPATYVASTPVPTLPPTAATASASTPTPSPSPAATGTAVTGNLAPETTPTPAGTPSGTATPGAATPTATPSPTVGLSGQPSPSATPTLFTGASGFSADRSSAGGLFVGDGASPRVVRFGVNGSVPEVPQQYGYGAATAVLQGIIVAPDGATLFGWSGTRLIQLTLPGLPS